MYRPLLALLTGAMLSSLSCAVTRVTPVELPHVLAPPPEAATTPYLEIAAVRTELATRRNGLTEAELDTLAETIVFEADRNGLELSLVMAVMFVESRYRNFSVSRVGALGLMQIMPATGEELAEQHGVAWHGPQTLFDPLVNVKLGTAYLAELIARYDGNVPTALAAYNWGPSHIDRRIARGRRLPTEYPGLVQEAHVLVQYEGSRF